jgi:transcriptional regulator with XRE-family HTH domain
VGSKSKRSEQAEFVGEKVDFLFRTFLKPSGDEYSLEEVGRATGFHASYIGRMRDRQVSNPGRDVLEALSEFFGVDPGFWFRANNTLVEPASPWIHVLHRQIDQADLTPEQAQMFTRMVNHVLAAVKQLQIPPEKEDPPPQD